MTERVCYCTLAEAKNELEAESNTDDATLLTHIEKASARIDQIMSKKPRSFFAPFQEQLRLALDSKQMLDGGLSYRTLFPLQSFSEILLEATDITASIEVDQSNNGKLRWIASSSNFANELANHAKLSPRLLVTGVWGFSRDYASAWLDSTDTVQDNPLMSGATTLTVTDSTLFAVGQLLQIESEWLLVQDLPSATTLTVKRGVHGTSAASHVLNTQIDIFQVDDVVRRLCARQAALWYARQGAFQQQSFDGVGVVSYPPDLLTELEPSLRELTYVE